MDSQGLISLNSQISVDFSGFWESGRDLKITRDCGSGPISGDFRGFQRIHRPLYYGSTESTRFDSNTGDRKHRRQWRRLRFWSPRSLLAKATASQLCVLWIKFVSNVMNWRETTYYRSIQGLCTKKERKSR